VKNSVCLVFLQAILLGGHYQSSGPAFCEERHQAFASTQIQSRFATAIPPKDEQVIAQADAVTTFELSYGSDYSGTDDDIVRDMQNKQALLISIYRGPKSKLTGSFLKHLGNQSHLVGLHMNGNGWNLSRKSVEYISTVRSLRNLTIESHSLSDQDISSISLLSNLEGLQVISDKLTDEGLINAVSNLSLKRLSVESQHVSGAFVKRLSHPDAITQLSLMNCDINDDVLKKGISLKNLESLDLRGCSKITDEGISEMPIYEHLHVLVASNTNLGMNALGNLEKQPNLTTLSLDDNHISDLSMATIARLPKLSILDLKRAIITNVGLDNLSKTNSIERLYLNGCNSVDDESISSLAKMKGLVILDVSDTKVSRSGKRRLSKKMKSTLIW
jgi:hypothetical protein